MEGRGEVGVLQTVARCSHVTAALRSLGRHLLPLPPPPSQQPVQMARAAFRGNTGETPGRLQPGGAGRRQITGAARTDAIMAGAACMQLLVS